MDLEWDEEKRRITRQMRGLDFADVVRFEPDSLLTVEDMRQDYGEARFNTTGMLDGVPCTFCWTVRDGCMRIISMRKINDRERKVYERARLRTPDAG